jgi:hypothetical protein
LLAAAEPAFAEPIGVPDIGKSVHTAEQVLVFASNWPVVPERRTPTESVGD